MVRFSVIKASLIVLSFGLPCGARDIPQPETLNDTILLMQEALSKEPTITELAISPDNMNLHMKVRGIEMTAYPDNLHRSLNSAESDAERGRILDEHVAAIVQTEDVDKQSLTPETLTRVRPVLRNIGVTEGADGADAVAQLPFAGDLAIYWVIDSETTAAYVSKAMLADADLDLSALSSQASANLAALAPEARWEDLGPTASVLTYDGYYESSFALDPALLHEFRGWTNFVMAVPTRDTFIVVDGSDDETVIWLRGVAKELAEKDGYRLSEGIYRFDGSTWVPY